jgi:putative endonuclease
LQVLRLGRTAQGASSIIGQMYSVYVLRNPQGRLYVGSTSDLKRRVLQHQSDGAGWTRGRGPWELVHYEHFHNRAEAMGRERELKMGRGRHWLQDHLKR